VTKILNLNLVIMISDNLYIYGRNAVIEALKAEKSIEKIYFSFGVQGDSISSIYSLAKKQKVNCITYDKRKFLDFERNVLKFSEKSQGVIALLSAFESVSLEDLIDYSFTLELMPVLVALDGINDPHNLGAIARTALCSGAAGLIITERDSAPITPAAIKASAGALEHIKLAKVVNLNNAIQKLKDSGYWIIGTHQEAEELYTSNIYDRPVVVIIGSEGKGLHHSVISHCDYLVKIPVSGGLSSLNASVSAGIILFEIKRQKIIKN
jgi:23S rRNA (guanosine2251-2'-O)-methyltransferase